MTHEPPPYAEPVMKFARPGRGGIEPPPIRNPRVCHVSWLAINFVPVEYHEDLARRLDEIQLQAVYMAATRLREAGMAEAADLIDPGDGSN
ncbi:hypothetical protein [Streptomyces hydrogenans]|uniref:hypothetical protein n=1 Tax=Streptomyces hydrogenans TaxID=1873719 RepID=UPI003819AC73